MTPGPTLPSWTRSASLSVALHAGAIGALLWGSPLGAVRGTERAGPRPSLAFVRHAPSEERAEPRPEPLPALEVEREPRVEPTVVRPVPTPPEPLAPPPPAPTLARVEFLPPPVERLRADALGRRSSEPPVDPAPLEASAAAPPPAEVLAPDPDRAGEVAGVVVLPVPRADASPEPTYPTRALRRRQEGTVLCKITVAADGRVLAVVVDESSGHDDLDRAARAALERWHFEPGSRAGVPCELDVWKEIVFRLPR